jgi:hypothetical protein
MESLIPAEPTTNLLHLDATDSRPSAAKERRVSAKAAIQGHMLNKICAANCWEEFTNC